jgi:hypothetical protein
MLSPEKRIDGNEWQDLVHLWLTLRYQGQYEKVPDEHIGDFGIEGFSRDGKAYQCYAPKNPLQSGDLYGNQRAKMTRDINKFINNCTELQKLFGDLKIREWWFVTPEHRSARLTQHAEKKRKEVLENNVPYVHSEFFIHIATAEDFSIEKEAAINSQLQKLKIDGPSPDDIEILEWSDENDQLVRTIDDKVCRLIGTYDTRKILKLRNEIIRHYIAGQNRIDKLRDQSCGLYEKVIECKKDREKFLILECETSPDSPQLTLKNQLDQIENSLVDCIPNLHKHSIREIAYGLINGWIIDCPLDFTEGKDVC